MNRSNEDERAHDEQGLAAMLADSLLGGRPDAQLLVRYCDDPASLSSEERAQVEWHLEHTPGCDVQLRLLRATDFAALEREAGSAAAEGRAVAASVDASGSRSAAAASRPIAAHSISARSISARGTPVWEWLRDRMRWRLVLAAAPAVAALLFVWVARELPNERPAPMGTERPEPQQLASRMEAPQALEENRARPPEQRPPSSAPATVAPPSAEELAEPSPQRQVTPPEPSPVPPDASERSDRLERSAEPAPIAPPSRRETDSSGVPERSVVATAPESAEPAQTTAPPVAENASPPSTRAPTGATVPEPLPVQLAWVMPTYQPPADAEPRPRRGAALRGAGSAVSLAAIVPEHVAHTLQPAPTLYWYISELPPAGSEIEFAITTPRSTQPLVRGGLERPTKPGLQAISLASRGVTLPLDQECRWSIVIRTVPGDPSSEAFASGWIRRIEASVDLERRLERASPGQRPAALAEVGLWYDAFAELVQLEQQRPDDSRVARAVADLIEQAGLELR